MSATTYLTRKEELDYDITTRSSTIRETIIWDCDGSDFAISITPYLNDNLSGELDLEELEQLAEAEELPELTALVGEEGKRDNLDSTDYELAISY